MVLIQIIVDTLFWLGEHWQEATALGVINVVAIAVGKRVSIIQLKKLLGFDDRKEMQEFSLRQKAVLNNQRAMMRAMGVEDQWLGNGQISRAVEAKNSKRSFLSSPVGMLLLNILRRVKKIMSSKFKSRKFWMAVITAVLVILNDGLDLGINQETVLTFAGLVVTWVLGESLVDAKRVKGEDKTDYSKSDDLGA